MIVGILQSFCVCLEIIKRNWLKWEVFEFIDLSKMNFKYLNDVQLDFL